MQISVIIPMYNESKIIEQTAKTLSEYMERTFDSYEILFSDDGSSDGCGELVRAMELPSVRVIGYGENRGKGSAVRLGMMEGQGDLLLFTDADLAYGTDVIKAFWETFCNEEPRPDLLVGSRNLHKDGYAGYTPIRKFMSKVYLKILQVVGGLHLSDSQCGCKAFRREAAREIFSRCCVDGFAFDFEAILWSEQFNMSAKEIGVTIINHRESKIRYIHDTIRMLKDLRNIRKRIKQVEKTSAKKR